MAFVDVTPKFSIAQEEVFGPVVAALPFGGFKQLPGTRARGPGRPDLPRGVRMAHDKFADRQDLAPAATVWTPTSSERYFRYKRAGTRGSSPAV